MTKPPPIPPGLLTKHLNSTQAKQPTQSTTTAPVFTMNGVGELLEVFSDKLAITVNGIMGFLTKGPAGTKTIPFRSITAIQFKKAGLTRGILQFTIRGGRESHGIFGAASDENGFMFASDGPNKHNNDLALEIKNYIEERVQEMHEARSSAPPNLSDELQKLAVLKSQGVLSDSEFQAAKKRLLS